MELSRRNVVTHASAYLSIIIEALEFLEIKWNTYVLNNSDNQLSYSYSILSFHCQYLGVVNFVLF